MRVFLAGTSFRPSYGGPAFSVSRLATALSESGVNVLLWAPDGSAETTNLLPATTLIRRLGGSATEALASSRPIDVLHDNGIWLPHNHAIAKLAASLCISRLVSIRGMLEPWALNHKRWKKRAAWLLYQKRDLKLACLHHATAETESENILRLRLGVPVSVVPNGVDIPQLEYNSRKCELANTNGSTRKTALFLSRIHPKKGLPLLIEAWARVRPVGWNLKIAGPDAGGHRAELERVVSVSGLSDVVSFLGQIEAQEKWSVYSSADLFILPTHSENFGMAIAEALAHGVPVLTTTGAPWPMLEAVGCGWQVETTPAGLIEGVRRATSCDVRILKAMGRRGREFVKTEFGWDQVAQKIIGLYEAILGASNNRTRPTDDFYARY